MCYYLLGVNNMNYFFIDYENVKEKGFNGILNLMEDSKVYIFYSSNANSLTFDLHNDLNESKAAINYFNVNVGSKNALDFQLSSYLGYVICNDIDKKSKFYIVTKDNGFNCLAKFWRQIYNNLNIQCVADISGSKIQTAEDVQSNMLKQVKALLDGIADDEMCKFVVGKILSLKTKLGINNAIMNELKDSKKTSEIYNAIKPLIKDKK